MPRVRAAGKRMGQVGQQALIFYFKNIADRADEMGLDDLDALVALQEQLAQAIEPDGIGEVDGNEIAMDGSEGSLYAYGPDARAMLQAVLPVVDSLRSDVEASKLAGPVPEQIRVGADNGPSMVGLLRGIRNLFTGTDVVTESENGLAGLIELVSGGHVHLAAIHESMGQILLPALKRIELRDRVAELQKVIKDARKQASKQAEGDVAATARAIAEAAGGSSDGVIVAEVPGADADTLRKAMDVIRSMRPDAPMSMATRRLS